MAVNEDEVNLIPISFSSEHKVYPSHETTIIIMGSSPVEMSLVMAASRLVGMICWSLIYRHVAGKNSLWFFFEADFT